MHIYEYVRKKKGRILYRDIWKKKAYWGQCNWDAQFALSSPSHPTCTKWNSFKMNILKLILKNKKVTYNEWAYLILIERELIAYVCCVDMQSNNRHVMRPQIKFWLVQLQKLPSKFYLQFFLLKLTPVSATKNHNLIKGDGSLISMIGWLRQSI